MDQPKGIEVVKEGIRKLKFNQQLKKAEGSKTPKVELTVSIDGVAIHEPKTKVRLLVRYRNVVEENVASIHTVNTAEMSAGGILVIKQ